MTTAASAERAHPQSPADLFWTCSALALQGFGGVLAVAQRQLVDRKRWLTPQEFVEDWAVAQTLPGPNVINLAMIIGDRHFGLRGALAAASGLLCFPLVIAFVLVLAYGALAHLPVVQGALRGMGAVAAGVVAGAGLRLLPALKGNVMGRAVCAAAAATMFALVAWWRVPIGFALLGIGGLCIAWAWHRLRARGMAAPGGTA